MTMVINCSFRIIGLTDTQLTHLTDNYLIDIEYRKGSDHRDRSQKLLRIILDEKTDSEFLAKLLSVSPENVYCDFFISASSVEETIVVEIPEYVLNLREKVGGKICFSYTCV